MFRSNWRDSKAWEASGFPLTTPSDEACKLYDAALTQMYSFRDDATVGGVTNTMERLLTADPHFVMGHVMVTNQKLGGTTFISPDDPVRCDVDKLVKMAEKQPLRSVEKKHVDAVTKLLDSNILGAIRIWNSILMENPFDLMAVRNMFFGCMHTGKTEQLRDAIGRMMLSWKRDMPLYSYLLGMYGFVLQETNFYDRGEREARKALHMNQNDIFATHALSHVLEMQGRAEEGIRFMQDTERNWKVCEGLTCHIYWHYALYHVENGNYEDALGIFDSEILPRFQRKSNLPNLTDSSSLLYRLGMEGVGVGDRWQDLMYRCGTHVDTHVNTYRDNHVLMACLGAADRDATHTFMDTLKKSARNVTGFSKTVSENVIIPLCEAMVAYEEGRFGEAVELTYPIRYDVIDIGGSNAQRDTFNLFLIDASLKSDRKEHRCIGRNLLFERKALKENSPLVDRWMQRFLVSHAD